MTGVNQHMIILNAQVVGNFPSYPIHVWTLNHQEITGQQSNLAFTIGKNQCGSCQFPFDRFGYTVLYGVAKHADSYRRCDNLSPYTST